MHRITRRNEGFKTYLLACMDEYLKIHPNRATHRHYKQYCTPEGISEQIDKEIALHPDYARITYAGVFPGRAVFDTEDKMYPSTKCCVINFKMDKIYRLRFTGKTFASNDHVIEMFKDGEWKLHVPNDDIREVPDSSSGPAKETC